jgi:FkbM family methyltransferase
LKNKGSMKTNTLKFINRLIFHFKNGTLIKKSIARILINIDRLKYNCKKRKRDNCIKLMKLKMIDGKIIHSFGENICLQLYNDSKLTEHIICDRFEESELSFVSKYLRMGDVFVDIGANIGLYTVIAGHTVGPNGKIYSFEPCTQTFLRLEENVRLNKLQNVNCYQYAVSDLKGKQLLNISIDNWDAWNSLAKPTGIGTAEFKTELVKTICFDDFAREHKILGKIVMMKIDVEGWEYKVLKGAFQVLTNNRPPILLVEFNKDALVSAGVSGLELERYLMDIDYKFYVFHKKSNRLVDYISDGIYDLNLIAIKREEDISYLVGRIL